MPISEDASAATLWQAFCEARGAAYPMPGCTVFGHGPAQQTELCELALAGRKRATTSLAGWYATGEALPQVGAFNILCDGSGTARGVIETIQVDIAPFSAVDAEFAAAEGEGDGSLGYWQHEHRTYFSRSQAEDGSVFSEDLPVVLQRFHLIFGTPAP
jgi:uncharacterized protein YhfF